MHVDNAFSKVCRADTSLIIITIFLFSANPSTVHAQRITGTTLLEGNVTCDGAKVIFTCETMGSVGLAWSSDDYINSEITFVSEDISDPDRKQMGTNGYDTIAKLIAVNNNQQTLTSELHINASVSRSTASSVTCRPTTENERATQPFQIFAPPSAPNNLTAVRVAYMDQCFYTALWQRPTVINSYQANVTNYIVSLNGNVKFNKTVDVTSDKAEFSASFQDTCETGHMISVTAGSICGMGPPIMYTMDQEECSELKIEDIPQSCYGNVGPTPSMHVINNKNKGEINNGNVNNIIAISGFVVTTILLLGSW